MLEFLRGKNGPVHHSYSNANHKKQQYGRVLSVIEKWPFKFLERKLLLLHARIQEFLSGGGGFPGLTARKQPGHSLTEGVQWFYCRENYTFPRIQRGSNIFRVGSNFFQGGGGGGGQMLISIETHITCDFLGGVGPDLVSPPSGSAHELHYDF